MRPTLWPRLVALHGHMFASRPSERSPSVVRGESTLEELELRGDLQTANVA